MMNPAVTVLMAVYNGETWLREAVESILSQTFEDFEFLIIDDGSTDRTFEILNFFRDRDFRIRLVRNESNLGLITSLNRGLELAKGTYIARMDADDISLPNRLETQVEYMEQHPEVGVCSAWLETFGKKRGEIWKSPLRDEEIKARLFCNSCIWHPAAIMRKEVFEQHGLCYNPAYPRSEDYKLWTEMAHFSKLANIPKVLVRYRLHENQETRRPNSSRKIRKEMAEAFLERELTESEKELHARLFFELPFGDRQTLRKIRRWADFLKSENLDRQTYHEPSFGDSLDRVVKKTIRRSFYFSIRNQKRYHPGIGIRILRNNMGIAEGFDRPERLKILFKSFLFWTNRLYSGKD